MREDNDMPETLGLNIVDSVRVTHAMAMLVPETLLAELNRLVDMPERNGTDAIAMVAIVGDMTATIGSKVHTVQQVQHSLWHISQLAHLYVAIGRLFDHPDASPELRTAWGTYLAQATVTLHGAHRVALGPEEPDRDAVQQPASTQSETDRIGDWLDQSRKIHDQYPGQYL